MKQESNTSSLLTPLRIWFIRLRAMTLKELLQLARDPALMLFTLYAFTLDIYLAGSGMNLQLNKALLMVRDLDHSYMSRELIHRFHPPYFHLKGEIKNSQEGESLLDRGKVMAVLDIPPHFQRDMAKGRTTSLQLQVDTTSSGIGLLAASYSAQIIGRFGLEKGIEQMGLSAKDTENFPAIEADYRVWYNENQEDSWFMSIAELFTVVTLFAILLPATAMVREKQKGTVEQLLVSPLTPIQILMPKVIAMTAVCLAGSLISVFLILKPIFHVPVRGSLMLFFVVTGLYVFTTAGLGLFISTITKNLIQAGLMAVLVLIPMVLLSGTWTPAEAMPWWLRKSMVLSPLHHYIDSGFGILLKGAGLAILWDSIMYMTGLGLTIFLFGLWRFRNQFG